eukprot:1074479_1
MSLLFTVRWLHTEKEIEDAQHLLYTVFFEQAAKPWKFSHNTPSKIAIVKCPCGKYKLIDRYTDICQWIGVFTGDKLVACSRVVERINSNDNLLEMETYPTFPHHRLDRKATSNPNTFEVNRTVVLHQYQNLGIMRNLYSFIARYALDKNRNWVGAHIARLLQNLNAKIL